MKKTREEIEQIAGVVVDAMLKVHRALGPAYWSRHIRRALRTNCVAGASRSERHSHQGRHQAHGQ